MLFKACTLRKNNEIATGIFKFFDSRSFMVFDTWGFFDFQNIPGHNDMLYIVLPICANYFYVMRAIWLYLIIFHDPKSYKISVSRSVLLCGAEIPRALPAVSQHCQSIPPTTSCLQQTRGIHE